MRKQRVLAIGLDGYEESLERPMPEAGVADFIERPRGRDPRGLGATEGDLVVVWRRHLRALQHPRLGRIRPIPFRRPG